MSSSYPTVSSFKNPDILLNDGDVLSFGSDKIYCIHTPGHTKGGFCFAIKDNIFTGDTLFMNSVGRTDFPGGDYNTLKNSLKKITIKSLP